MMEPPIGVFHPHESVGETIEKLRAITQERIITYCFITDEENKVVGVVTMRDLLLNPTHALLENLMLRHVFYLSSGMSLLEAMKSTLRRHFPVYPVCDEERRLVGLVRGQQLAQAQAFQLTAQAGAMVGVEKEEHLSTP